MEPEYKITLTKAENGEIIKAEVLASFDNSFETITLEHQINEDCSKVHQSIYSLVDAGTLGGVIKLASPTVTFGMPREFYGKNAKELAESAFKTYISQLDEKIETLVGKNQNLDEG